MARGWHSRPRTLREPAVAGYFYPASPDALQREIAECLATVTRRTPLPTQPKALIVPHAGYAYSGPVAATAYAALRPLRGRIRRVVLVGPAHRVAFRGLALSSADAFLTPLGCVDVARDAAQLLRPLAQVCELDRAHSLEHSLEVQLPFLQTVLEEFDIVPLVVGDATPEEVGGVLEALWGGPETIFIISSDLSHYRDYAAAQRIDRATTHAIESLDVAPIDGEHACGCRPICGMLCVARAHGLHATTLDLRNSGDTAGDHTRVVGYGAFAFS
jgi:AmmeMemoRadiSam system protein B